MRKFGILVLALGFAVQGFGREEEGLEGSLSCSSKRNYFGEVSLTARLIALPKANEGTMWEPVARVKENDAQETEVGKKDYLGADENYNPTRYKDHSRFDLSKMTDTKSFGSFHPSDSCRLQVLVPNKVFAKAPKKGTKKVSFTAPVVIGCDQGGGTIRLDCEVTPRED